MMRIRIQLPPIPSDLSAFLRQLTVPPTPLPPLVDNEILFPVDTVRSRFSLPSHDSFDYQRRQLRNRPREPWARCSATAFQPTDSPAAEFAELDQWLSEFRPSFYAEQAKLSQTSSPSITVVVLPPLPHIPLQALPPIFDHHPTSPSSLCFHVVPFDPHDGLRIRTRFLSPVVGPPVPPIQYQCTSSHSPLPRAGRLERVFRLQQTARPLHKGPPKVIWPPRSSSGPFITSVSRSSLPTTRTHVNYNAGVSTPLAASHVMSSDISEPSAPITPPMCIGFDRSGARYMSNINCLPTSCLPSNTPQFNQLPPRTHLTLYTWRNQAPQRVEHAPMPQKRTRGGRPLLHHTDEEQRAATRKRQRKYRAKLAAQKENTGYHKTGFPGEFPIRMDPLTVILGEAQRNRWYIE